jgi:hypothetical protein
MIWNPPVSLAIKDVIPNGWAEWFNEVKRACLSVQQSGTTAQRPVKNLWVGRRYFDTTLGYPIWYNGSVWVNSAGSTV